MLEPFGKALKIVFDNGCNSIDRLITNAHVDSQSPRKGHNEYNEYNTNNNSNNNSNGSDTFCCRNCQKIKIL